MILNISGNLGIAVSLCDSLLPNRMQLNWCYVTFKLKPRKAVQRPPDSLSPLGRFALGAQVPCWEDASSCMEGPHEGVSSDSISHQTYEWTMDNSASSISTIPSGAERKRGELSSLGPARLYIYLWTKQLLSLSLKLVCYRAVAHQDKALDFPLLFHPAWVALSNCDPVCSLY